MGMFIDQTRPPKPTWGVDDIPDLTGKVMIVTGGNTGIGYETIKALLNKNARVYMASRSKAKAEEAIQRLKEETGKEAIFLELDLADLRKVKKAAEEFMSKETQLDVLFNSGGVMAPPIEQLTADGYDLQFGTNVIGHFYFTKLLLPVLEVAAKNSPEKKSRVVTTSSSAHLGWGPKIRYETLKAGKAREKVGTQGLYAQSKYGNILVAKEFSRRYADRGIVFTSLNPGNLKTDLQRHWGSVGIKLTEWMLYPASYGALTQLYAGVAPEAKDLDGKYLIPWARVGDTREDAKDPKTAEELWHWLEEQVKDL